LDTPSLRLEGSNATSYPDFNIRRDIPETKTEPADEMWMKESDFDAIMGKALDVSAILGEAANDKRLILLRHRIMYGKIRSSPEGERLPIHWVG